MENLATQLTNYIMKKKVIQEEDYDIYHYGFLSGLEIMLYVIVCYGCAIWRHMTLECSVFLLVFYSVRSFAGGLHLSTYWRCFTCSCMILYFSLLAVEYSSIGRETAAWSIAIEIICLIFLKPVDHPNRPVEDGERQVFSKRIKQILLLISLMAIFFYVTNLQRYLVTEMYALAVVIVSMLLGKWITPQEKIE